MSVRTTLAAPLSIAAGFDAHHAARQPLPLLRLVAAHAAETRMEIRAVLRSPGFALPFSVVPLAVYLMFGVIMAGPALAESKFGPALADYLFCGFSVLAVSMPGIFTSALLATEREGRVLQLKRALPAPPGAVIVAKLLMSMFIAGVALALVVIAALLFGRLTASPTQLVIICMTLLIGSLPFTAIGLLLGSWCSASAAPAWGNLLFLPMMWLSGLFIPLPASLERWVVIWPTFHLNQLALGLAGIEPFSFIDPAIAGAVLLALGVLCGGLAVRRLARVG